MGEHVENERLKLLAGALDRVSTAFFTIGPLAPLAAAVYGAGAVGSDLVFYLVAGGSWFLGGVALHLFARMVLGGLQ